MEEIWKDIEGYEGYYQVSNLGRVRSVERYVNHNVSGYKAHKEGKELAFDNVRKGYKRVNLYKENKHRHFAVHRLVAQAFISNPNNYPCINHKDCDPSNNRADNLEWCSYTYNNNYGNRGQKVREKMEKPIIGFDGVHKLGTYYPSATSASIYLRNKRTKAISNCLNGRSETAYGLKWEYA